MKDFKTYRTVNAAPEEVYAALTYAPTIKLWTGDAAEMEPVVDSEFSLWDGSIVGKNLEFEQDKKIVQQWYFGEDAEVPSIVTIKLHPDKKGTSIEVKHTNIPNEAYEDIAEGWEDVYLGSLESFYA